VRESSYRFRATFRRRWSGCLTLVLLIGLVGGVAMAAVAAARRTQSFFPTYVASTNPPDLQVFTEFGPITKTGFSEKVNEAVAGGPRRQTRRGRGRLPRHVFANLVALFPGRRRRPDPHVAAAAG